MGMNTIHFNLLDLNLLRVFDALIEERSVTKAGERLGLTQSAISHALNRLRHILNDDLFVRGSDGMQPTPRAAEIGPRLRQALRQLQDALHPAEFTPQLTERRFTITCSAYVATILLPEVVARLRAEAPLAELRIRPTEIGIAEELDAARSDLAIGAFGRIPDRFAALPLFKETMVWALSARHPAARRPITLERLAELPHLIVASTTEDSHMIDGTIVENGLERRVMRDDGGAFVGALVARGLRRMIGLTVPDAQSALAIVGRTDMAALIPRRLATAFAGQYRLKLFDPPYPSPPSEVKLLWHRDYGEQPAVGWLRELLRQVAAGL